GFRCPLTVYDSRSGEVTLECQCPCSDITALAVSPDGTQMAAAGRNGKLRLWAAGSGEKLVDLIADSRRVRAIAYSPDGKLVATGGDGPEVRLWDAST